MICFVTVAKHLTKGTCRKKEGRVGGWIGNQVHNFIAEKSW